MKVVEEVIKRYPPIVRDLTMVVSSDVTLAELRKLPRENYKSIEARGFLHRKLNLVEWINQFWGMLCVKGCLHLTVPLGATAWDDPFAAREINQNTFGRFDIKNECYSADCRPFQSVTQSITGNDLSVRLQK